MNHSRPWLIVALAIIILAPGAVSPADAAGSATLDSSVRTGTQSAVGGDSSNQSGPHLATDLTPGEVFRGAVTFGGTASDGQGVARVRVGIRDLATGKWLHPDGKFRKAFRRVAAAVDSAGEVDVTWRVSLDLDPGKYSANVKALDAFSNPTTLRLGRFKVRRPSAFLAAAGDVADCNRTSHHRTAELLDSVFSGRDGVVALLGDGAYPQGSTDEYRRCYDPTWGKHKGRTRPAVGNHDYLTPGAAGYYDYFGTRAGDASRGYYAYDLESWRIIVLNSECAAAGGCAAGSAQHKWLQYQLANTAGRCVLTYSHRPRYTSGPHPDGSALTPLWQLLHEAGTDVALAGHSHNYQRFRKMNAIGNVDATGIRSFVVGTGGVVLKETERRHPGMKLKRESQHGVLLMELRQRSYTWEFITVDGDVTDSGKGSCR